MIKLQFESNIMSYMIKYDKKNYLVKLKIFGMNIKDEHLFVQNETFKICKKHECSHLLIDLRYLNNKSRNIQEYFNIGNIIAKRYIGIKIANVLAANSKNKENTEFISKIECNDGHNCQDFTSIKEAINWFHKYYNE